VYNPSRFLAAASVQASLGLVSRVAAINTVDALKVEGLEPRYKVPNRPAATTRTWQAKSNSGVLLYPKGQYPGKFDFGVTSGKLATCRLFNPDRLLVDSFGS